MTFGILETRIITTYQKDMAEKKMNKKPAKINEMIIHDG